MSCMAHELQVCNFSPATPNLVLNIDDHSDHIGMVLSGYRRCMMILRDKFYRKSNGWQLGLIFSDLSHQSDIKIVRSNLDQIMIDSLALANGQFRAIFLFWQWIIHQIFHFLRCSSWKVTLKLLRKSYIRNMDFLCFQKVCIPKYTTFSYRDNLDKAKLQDLPKIIEVNCSLWL